MTTAMDRGGMVRVAWAFVGGTIGASLGFGGLGSLPHNADGFGTMLAQGFFLFFACVGVVAGMVLGALIGRTVEALLRRLGANASVTLLVATVVTVSMLALIRGRVLAQYPGLHARSGAPQHTASTRLTGITPDSTTRARSTQSVCAAPPPTGARELRLWREECR